MAMKKVNTATLIRGGVYTLRHPDNKPQSPKDSLKFTRNKAEIIEDVKILNMLEKLKEEVRDGEGEVYEKPVFRINRNVDAPDGDDDGTPARHRLSSERVVKRKPPASRR